LSSLKFFKASNYPKLKELLLSYNYLEGVPEELAGVSELKLLDMR